MRATPTVPLNPGLTTSYRWHGYITREPTEKEQKFSFFAAVMLVHGPSPTWIHHIIWKYLPVLKMGKDLGVSDYFFKISSLGIHSNEWREIIFWKERYKCRNATSL